MTKNVGAIIQARCNSTRLKNKVLYSVNNVSLIEFLVKRLSKSKKIKTIIVATTKDKSDKLIAINGENCIPFLSTINIPAFL